MSSNVKKKSKSKSSGVNTKKPYPRIEAIQVTAERKKKCNDKALQIVTEFSEGTISEDRLLENLRFINQEYYQDIIEERAISKFCGYPLCSEILKNIPSKQYHISTTLNKVFDITDRKNFCSNMCYKASKFLKDQVSTSPLWLREDDSATSFTLISLKSRGGMSGDEVNLGSPTKLEIDEVLSPSSMELNDNSALEDVGDKSDIFKNDEDHTKDGNSKTSVEYETDENKSVISSSKSLLSDNNSLSEDKIACLEKQSSKQESFFGLEDQCQKDLSKASVDSKDAFNVNKHNEYQAVESTTMNKNVNSSGPTTSKGDIGVFNGLIPPDKSQTQSNITKSHKHSSKRKSGKQKIDHINTNPIQNVVLKIEKILREWISIDSLCFIFGEEKIKEILAENKNQNLPTFTQDVHFYERYLAICKKLNLLELEDTKIDVSYRDEAKKPLPDYEALKEEARQMEIKVKMFFKGDKVKFEQPELSEDTETKNEAVEIEPILPLVDVHAQKALRRRIVIGKLRKVLQDLQKSLGLRGFNLTEDLRTLVSTLTLSAHNITMKPAEWNLVSLAIIKLLSLRDNLLAQALNTSTTKKHLTLLLMSFSLDSGYLDRLMEWLTDVEAVLRK